MKKENKKEELLWKYLGILVEAFIGALIIIMIFFIIVEFENDAIVEALNNIKDTGSALKYSLIMFPVAYLICLVTNLANFVMVRTIEKKRKKKAN